MRIFEKQLDNRSTIQELRSLREELNSYADALRREMESASFSESRNIEKKLEQIVEDDLTVKDKLTEAHRDYHSAFHPRWGQMFMAGYQGARLRLLFFAHCFLHNREKTHCSCYSFLSK